MQHTLLWSYSSSSSDGVGLWTLALGELYAGELGEENAVGEAANVDAGDGGGEVNTDAGAGGAEKVCVGTTCSIKLTCLVHSSCDSAPVNLLVSVDWLGLSADWLELSRALSVG